jgi:hypothetical protein
MCEAIGRDQRNNVYAALIDSTREKYICVVHVKLFMRNQSYE